MFPLLLLVVAPRMVLTAVLGAGWLQEHLLRLTAGVLSARVHHRLVYRSAAEARGEQAVLGVAAAAAAHLPLFPSALVVFGALVLPLPPPHPPVVGLPPFLGRRMVLGGARVEARLERADAAPGARPVYLLLLLRLLAATLRLKKPLHHRVLQHVPLLVRVAVLPLPFVTLFFTGRGHRVLAGLKRSFAVTRPLLRCDRTISLLALLPIGVAVLP